MKPVLGPFPAIAGTPAHSAAGYLGRMAMHYVAACLMRGLAAGRLLIRRVLRGFGRSALSPPSRQRSVGGLGVPVLCVAMCLDVSFADPLQVTQYPSSKVPDQVLLSWAGDPATTLTVQWRTTAETAPGEVRYRPRGSSVWQVARAEIAPLETASLGNDQKINWHSARLSQLLPDTSYEYAIGYPGGWLETRAFVTAPKVAQPFSFLYISDSQGASTESALRPPADAAFVLHAGDLVNEGCNRADWDAFFHSLRTLLHRLPLLPAPGNHDDCPGADPQLYTYYFDLPGNGSPALPPEQSYHFTYGNVLVVSLNSNLAVEAQASWLEEVLSASNAQWKFLLWHHPAYSSRKVRDNREVRERWGALAEKYGVDIVFQGHDHAYARSKPLHGGGIADASRRGVIYLISVVGKKYYRQDPSDYFAVGFEGLSTYQVIHIDGGQLRYESYDMENNLVDRFSLLK